MPKVLSTQYSIYYTVQYLAVAPPDLDKVRNHLLHSCMVTEL